MKNITENKSGCCVNKLFRLTEKAATQLKMKADERGISESAYIRLLLIDTPGGYPEIRQELARLNNEINHIGNNINQIAKNNNSYLYLESDKARLTAYMKQLKQSVYAVNERLNTLVC